MFWTYSSLTKFHLYMHDFGWSSSKSSFTISSFVLYILVCLSYVYSSVTEVVWEGEETEPKKADTDAAKKADTGAAKKADYKASTNAINRLVLYLHLNGMNEILETTNTSNAAWHLVKVSFEA